MKINTKFVQNLINMVPQWVNHAEILNDELIIHAYREDIHHLVYFLQKHMHCQYKILISMHAVDYPSDKERFELSYNFLSVRYNSRVRIKIRTNETSPVQSIISIYRTSGWFEREIWDMFGIFFENHPDLRRLLTDYGFQGHPLRKDFPLTGYTELRYDDEQKRIISEPIRLTQEYRNFDFTSPWEQS